MAGVDCSRVMSQSALAALQPPAPVEAVEAAPYTHLAAQPPRNGLIEARRYPVSRAAR